MIKLNTIYSSDLNLWRVHKKCFGGARNNPRNIIDKNNGLIKYKKNKEKDIVL